MPAEPLSLLIYVHEDLLGDALLKLPAVSVLRDAFPGHRIVWRAGGGGSIFNGALAPLIEGLVDEVRDTDPLGRSWREWLRPPAGPGADIIIDTQTVARSTLLLRRLPHRLFISPALRFLLSDRRPRGRRLDGNLSQRLLALFRLASGRQDLAPRWRLRLPRACRESAAALLPAGPVYVGLAPGAGGRDKCWPLARYLELAREQQRRGRVPVFFLGPREADWAGTIRAAVPAARLPEQEADAALAGPLLALALAERIQAGVANDAGPGHLMAAAGAPLVSLFGRTSEEKFIDSGGRRRVVRARDHGGSGVAAIPCAAVAAALEAVLEAAA